MDLFLDLETSIAVACAIGVAIMFFLAASAVSEGASGRRFKRRFAAVRDRAQGVASADAVATRSLARQQSATPKIDRIARRWLPRRDLLAARLARTGRAISIGQYGIVIVTLTALSALGLAVMTRI